MENSKKTSALSLTNTISLVVLFVIIIILVVLLIRQYVIYTSDYVQKDYVQKFYIEKTLLAFSDLPKAMRNLYITRSSNDLVNKKVNSNIDRIEKSTIFSAQNENVIFVTQIECENFLNGSYSLLPKCANLLKKRFQTLDNSMIFEIIPIVSEKDFEFFKILISDNDKNDILDNREEDINNFIDYANSGLSMHRANEAVWALKQHFGEKVIIRPSSFHMFTKDKAGFIIKVFNNIK